MHSLHIRRRTYLNQCQFFIGINNTYRGVSITNYVISDRETIQIHLPHEGKLLPGYKLLKLQRARRLTLLQNVKALLISQYVYLR